MAFISPLAVPPRLTSRNGSVLRCCEPLSPFDGNLPGDIPEAYKAVRGRKPRPKPSTPPEADSSRVLRAPNGLPTGPADLLDELLPLLAQEEQKENEPVSEHVRVMREKIAKECELFASMHRVEGRNANLRPFKLRNDREKCEKCKGKGTVTCEYCEGECFVDLTGKEVDGMIDVGEGKMVPMPTKLMEGYWDCPVCEGVGKEKCSECSGSGKKERERKRGEAREGVSRAAEGQVDDEVRMVAELLGNGEYEVGLDGLVVIRRRKRGRRAKKKQVVRRDVPAAREDDKSEMPDLSRDGHSSADLPARKQVGKSTDFVHTTDFKVGKKLQDQL